MKVNVKETAKNALAELENLAQFIWILDNGDPNYPDESSEETVERIVPDMVRQYSLCVKQIKKLID